jgi:hypothetical protein
MGFFKKWGVTESVKDYIYLCYINKKGTLHIKKAMAVSKRLIKNFVKAYILVS